MQWLTEHQWEAWLMLALLLGAAEVVSTDLVLLMLAGGALAGMGTALLVDSFVVQGMVAAATAIALLVMLRPNLLKRLHAGPELVLGPRKLIGRQAVVTEGITGLEPGRIKIDGESWSALPYDESLKINTGETVDVLQIKGATAYVHPVPRIE